MHRMNIPDRTGHTVVEWDTEKKDTVDEARQVFEKIYGRGNFMATVVNPVTKEATQVHSFDPEAEEITFIVPLQGG